MRKAAWVCLPFAGAVAVCRYLLPENAWIPAVVACLLLLIPCSLLRGRARACVFLALCGAAAGCAAFSVQLYAVLRPCEALAGEQKTVSARVTDYPDLYDGSAYVTVRLTEPGVPRVRCRLVSYMEGELDGLVPGDELRGQVRFASAAVRNGQQVDSYTSQGIFLRAVCTDEPAQTGRWRFSSTMTARPITTWPRRDCPMWWPCPACTSPNWSVFSFFCWAAVGGRWCSAFRCCCFLRL